MSLLGELKAIFTDLKIPCETAVFSGKAPNRYVVLTPLVDTFVLHGDNTPNMDVEEVRISLFDKGNYLEAKSRIEQALMSNEITIAARRYVDHEDDTGYNNYAIDVAKNYLLGGN